MESRKDALDLFEQKKELVDKKVTEGKTVTKTVQLAKNQDDPITVVIE